MFEIDGSYGEGGGQILRTLLALSCVIGKPFRLYNIRKGRDKPGLRPQHLMCVRACREISGARVAGDEVGSIELTFSPGGPKPGSYSFDIGTAGSTSLLFQTLLPPLLVAGGESSLTLEGGTHVPFSPPFHFISEVFLPTLSRLGVGTVAAIERYGFYPRGGGRVSFLIRPCTELQPCDMTVRGTLRRITGVSAVGNLPRSIAERQRASALSALGGLRADVEEAEVRTPGQGTFVFLRAESEGAVAGFSSLGKRGKRAEAVGEEAARELLDYHRTGACLDYHMADQITLYLALAEGSSRFTASKATGHLKTNLHVIGEFLGVRSGTGPEGEVTINGRGMP